MPLSASATRTQLADQTRIPRRQVAGTGLVVNVRLTFENKNFIPEDLFDALEAKYGSGKVTADNDSLGHGNFALRIKP
jgi:hypothetical protein